MRIGRADPLGKIRADYRLGQRRFGVSWAVLAAVNFVESDFGRIRSKSVSGAEGPMQFMPSTWRAYGHGDVNDPRPAILAAADLLRNAGAPSRYGRALYAYNPSRLYVDAVLRYAGVLANDREALYLLYAWRPG